MLPNLTRGTRAFASRQLTRSRRPIGGVTGVSPCRTSLSDALNEGSRRGTAAGMTSPSAVARSGGRIRVQLVAVAPDGGDHLTVRDILQILPQPSNMNAVYPTVAKISVTANRL